MHAHREHAKSMKKKIHSKAEIKPIAFLLKRSTANHFSILQPYESFFFQAKTSQKVLN